MNRWVALSIWSCLAAAACGPTEKQKAVIVLDGDENAVNMTDPEVRDDRDPDLDDEGEDTSPKVCTGFADDATTWRLPPTGFSADDLDRLANTYSCGSSALSHTVTDLDGDGLPDLVVLDRCDEAGVGHSRWDVYLNTGSGFAESPAAWAVPSNYGTDAFNRIANSTSCSNGSFTYALLDLNGDGRPDLVVTDACDEEGVGHNRWAVHLNTGTSFEATATSWAVPEHYGSDVFDHTANAFDCGNGEDFSFVLNDLDGDQLPDLVVTDACDEAGVGHNRWDIYRNTGTGFAATATAWTLPEHTVFDTYDVTAKSASCDVGDFNFSLLDLRGEGRPDLVLTENCDDEAVGTSKWVVFENTGSGFGAPTTWTLPALGDRALGRTTELLSCENGEQFYFTLLNLSGGPVDLVVMDKCDEAGVGEDRWEVYRNVGDGFAADPTSWSLPNFGFRDILDRGSAAGSCAMGDLNLNVIDLNGDGAADLLVTDRCDEAGVGTDRWELHTATCE